MTLTTLSNNWQHLTETKFEAVSCLKQQVKVLPTLSQKIAWLTKSNQGTGRTA
jgi:hypothetical protein